MALTNINFNGVLVEYPVNIEIDFKVDFNFMSSSGIQLEFVNYFEEVKRRTVALYKSIGNDVEWNTVSFTYQSKSMTARLSLVVRKTFDPDYDFATHYRECHVTAVMQYLRNHTKEL